MIKLNVSAFLRDGTAATITGRVESGGFRIMGTRAAAPVELWTRFGRWREDGTDHPLDIIAVKNQEGQIVPFGEMT